MPDVQTAYQRPRGVTARLTVKRDTRAPTTKAGPDEIVDLVRTRLRCIGVLLFRTGLFRSAGSFGSVGLLRVHRRRCGRGTHLVGDGDELTEYPVDERR